MPNSHNLNFMQKHVPQHGGESVKEWLYRVSEHFCMSHEAIRYYYADKRSKRLGTRSRLEVNSDRINRVSLDNMKLKQKQGDVYADIIRQLKGILDTVDTDITSGD